MIRRRSLLTLLGGAATAWPVGAWAQQGERVRRVGVLLPAATDDTDFQVRVGAFVQALGQLGWIVGRNVRIDYRWSAGNADNIRKYAAELVAFAPDVILAHGASTVGPLLQANRSVPIVFPVVGDPVYLRRVPSTAKTIKQPLRSQLARLFIERDRPRLALHRRTIEASGDLQRTRRIGAPQLAKQQVDFGRVAGLRNAHVDVRIGMLRDHVRPRAS